MQGGEGVGSGAGEEKDDAEKGEEEELGVEGQGRERDERVRGWEDKGGKGEP